MAAIAQQLAATYPENKDRIARVSPFIEESIPSRIRTTFYTMMTAVLGVMLIACVNVTNLQLARAAERTKEFAIRTALGSGRWRILRQSLAEGLVLAAIGALARARHRAVRRHLLHGRDRRHPAAVLDRRAARSHGAALRHRHYGRGSAGLERVRRACAWPARTLNVGAQGRHPWRHQPAHRPVRPLARRRRGGRVVRAARRVRVDDSQHPGDQPHRLRLCHARTSSSGTMFFEERTHADMPDGQRARLNSSKNTCRARPAFAAPRSPRPRQGRRQPDVQLLEGQTYAKAEDRPRAVPHRRDARLLRRCSASRVRKAGSFTPADTAGAERGRHRGRGLRGALSGWQSRAWPAAALRREGCLEHDRRHRARRWRSGRSQSGHRDGLPARSRRPLSGSVTILARTGSDPVAVTPARSRGTRDRES